MPFHAAEQHKAVSRVGPKERIAVLLDRFLPVSKENEYIVLKYLCF